MHLYFQEKDAKNVLVCETPKPRTSDDVDDVEELGIIKKIARYLHLYYFIVLYFTKILHLNRYNWIIISWFSVLFRVSKILYI